MGGKKNGSATLSAVILFFIFLSIFSLSKILENRQTLQKKASSDSIAELTGELVLKYQEYVKTTNVQKRGQIEGNLFAIAAERQAFLKDEIERSPQNILNNLLPTDVRSGLSKIASVKPYIEEERKDIYGEVEVAYLENFQTSEAKLVLKLKTLSQKYNLHLVVKPGNITSGSRVKVSGVLLGKDLIIETVEGSYFPKKGKYTLRVTRPAAISATGDQRTIVILANFSANPASPLTREEVYDIVFSAQRANSVQNFYKENSFGQVSLSGDVRGWYTIDDFDGKQCQDNYSGWAASVDQKATADDVDFSNYKRRIYVFGGLSSCKYAGLGTVGGNPSYTYLFNDYNLKNPYFYAHEYGHNLGAQHASKLYCRDYSVQIDDYDKCYTTEYGDWYDVMGNAYHHFNGPHKVVASWISPDKIKTISTIGTYQVALSPLEWAGAPGSTQILKVYKPDTKEYYYLSYRRLISSVFSLAEGLGMTEGASVHIWDDKQYNNTKFLDTTPSNELYDGDAALADGREFYDQINNIRIKQISHNSSQVALEVNYQARGGPTLYPTYPPTSTPRPTITTRPTLTPIKSGLTPTRIPTSTPRPTFTPWPTMGRPSPTPTKLWPTLTKTPTSSPTRILPSPTLQPASLRFKLKNHNNIFPKNVNVTILVKDQWGNFVSSFSPQTTTSEGEGSVSLAGLTLGGRYYFYIEGDMHLRKKHPILMTIYPGQNPQYGSLDFGTITAGNVNKSYDPSRNIDSRNSIDLYDLVTIRSIENGTTVPPAPKYSDVNQDGIINLYDYTTVSANYGKRGDD